MTVESALAWCADHATVTRWYMRDGEPMLRVTLPRRDNPATVVLSVEGRDAHEVLLDAVGQLQVVVEADYCRAALRAV